jgi:hypothetical protein
MRDAKNVETDSLELLTWAHEMLKTGEYAPPSQS